MDTLTPQQRHKNMAAIRSKDTKPEMIVRRGLWKRGFRYRLNHKRLPGHPDLVLRKYRTCIFVNGCFWHGHKCNLTPTPSPKGEGRMDLKSSECCKIDLRNQRRAPASQTNSISSDDICGISIQNSECCKIDLGNQRRAPASQTNSISSDDICGISIQNSECCKIPKTNREFWVAKIRRNKERDKEEQKKLAEMGWHCITVWECELTPKKREDTLESIAFTLNRIWLQDHSSLSQPRISQIKEEQYHNGTSYPQLEEEDTHATMAAETIE